MIRRSTLIFLTCLTALSAPALKAREASAFAHDTQNTASTFLISQAVDDSQAREESSSSTNVLSIGSRGQAVRALQTRLKESNFYEGPLDGIYGLGTQRSVRNFQESQGLDITGRLDDETWAALDSFEVAAASESNTSPANPSGEENANAQTAAPEATDSERPVAADTSNSEAASSEAASLASEGNRLGRLFGVGLGLVALVASFGIGFFLANRTKDDDALPAEEDAWGQIDPAGNDAAIPQAPTVMNGSNGNGYGANAALAQNSLAQASNMMTSGQIGGTAPLAQVDIVDGLIKDLHNPDPSKRRKVIWELGQRGNSLAVNPLVDAMVNADSKEKSLVLAALSEIGIRSLKPMNRALAIALQDENPEVRKNAIRDLTRIYELVVQISQMLGHATEDEDPEVRQTATWALDQLNRIRRTQDVDATMRAFPGGASAKPIDLLSSEASLRRSQSERL
ncbi:MAG: peptidoglycan-binding protein [Cyanobacteria bacterium J06632_3]